MSTEFFRKYIDIINEAHYPGHMYSKLEANYTDQAVGDNRCGNCKSFRSPNHCRLVSGEISPMGWCKYYQSKMLENLHHIDRDDEPEVNINIDEKWGTPTKVSPEEKGKYAGKTKAELLKSYNALKRSGPHKKGSPEYGRMRELAFAIRAKSGWGKVKE